MNRLLFQALLGVAFFGCLTPTQANLQSPYQSMGSMVENISLGYEGQKIGRWVQPQDVADLKRKYAGQNQRLIRIGILRSVLQSRDVDNVMLSKEFLTQVVGYKNIAVYYFSEPELQKGITDGFIDFVIAPAQYFAREGKVIGIDLLASMVPATMSNPEQVTGSVIFTKKNLADVSIIEEQKWPSYIRKPKVGQDNDLQEIRYKKIIATSQDSLDGWYAAAGAFTNASVPMSDLLLRTTFVGEFAYDKVVDEVLSGRVATGILPTCILEQMQKKGKLSLQKDIEVIQPLQGDGEACVRSTRLYPGIMLGATKNVRLETRIFVRSVLKRIQMDRWGLTWTDPASVRSIFDLFYQLKVGPYHDLASWDLRRILNEHGNKIAFILFFTVMSFFWAMFLQRSVIRKSMQLREELKVRQEMRAEVSQSREHISNLERTGLVGQMSTIIAHELKQPLGAIMNYANGLTRRQKNGRLTERALTYALKEIVDQAERASRIVERVRGYAKHDYPPRKVTDLAVVIDGALQTFRRSRTTSAQIHLSVASGAMARVDEWEIELAIHNLLKNAADAIAEVPNPEIRVSLEGDEANWLISVSDNGPYVTDEKLENLFKPLQTTKGASGLGLGLSIIASIVERHAGHVRVQRNPSGRGLKFTMTIPKRSHDSVYGDSYRHEKTFQVRRPEDELKYLHKDEEEESIGRPEVDLEDTRGPIPAGSIQFIERMTTLDAKKRGNLPSTIQTIGLAEFINLVDDEKPSAKEVVRQLYLDPRAQPEGVRFANPRRMHRGVKDKSKPTTDK